MKTILFFAAAALFASAAWAQQYKWVDQDGKVRYGDVPPPGVKATPLRPTPPAASAPAGKKDEKKLTPEQAFQKRQKDQKESEEKTAKEQQEAQIKRANCEQAQSYARTVAAGRVSRANSAGEQVYLDDAEIAREKQRAQQAVDQWCK